MRSLILCALLCVTTGLVRGWSAQDILNTAAIDGAGDGSDSGSGTGGASQKTGVPTCTKLVLPDPHWGDKTQSDYLAPQMSKETVQYHYYKHQAGYVTKLNAWFKRAFPDGAETSIHADSGVPRSLVVDMILNPDNNAQYSAFVKQLASQIYNHHLFFSTLDSPLHTWPDKEPTTYIYDKDFLSSVSQNFDHRKIMMDKMKAATVSHFGSGWVWLAVNRSATPPKIEIPAGLKVDYSTPAPVIRKLVIMSTQDAETPIDKDDTIIPLLVIDVWEHAYYIDHRNDKVSYFDQWAALINWKVVSDRFNWATVELPGGDGCVPNLRQKKYPSYLREKAL